MAEPVHVERAGALARFASTVASMPDAESDELVLAELVPPGQINLQGSASDQRFVRKVGAVLGCVLPMTPNSVQTAEKVTVLWLGPEEWLVLTPPGEERALVDTLGEALGDVAASIVDVSGSRARLQLRGVHARAVLGKGCPLDLHPSVFRPGQCAQTLLARSTILLHQLDEQATFDLFPRRSFAEYVWLWLEDAMREYGGRTLGRR